jgi:ABC-type taurine transport system ATPase subunit
MAAGVAESTWSGLLALPFLLLLAPPWSPDQLPLAASWTVLLACGMWTLERIAFFTLIQEKGAVFTVQAVYLSTRIVVMSPRPGRITDIIDSPLPRERPLDIRDSREFIAIAHRVREGLRGGHQDD